MNKTITTLIIDDEEKAIESVERHLSFYKDYQIIGRAKTLEEAIELTATLKPDLVFLDVILGENTGFDYLNAFMPNFDFEVIFTTAYDDYAIKAFDYCALHYLLKPISNAKFREGLSKMNAVISKEEQLQQYKSLQHNIQVTNGYKWIHISTIEKKYRVYSKDVLFIESDSNYAHIHLTDKTKITTSKTLKYYAKLLDNSHFYKVHKSYLVNTKQMKAYNRRTGELLMENDIKILVAVRRRKDFTDKFFN